MSRHRMNQIYENLRKINDFIKKSMPFDIYGQQYIESLTKNTKELVLSIKENPRVLGVQETIELYNKIRDDKLNELP